MPGERVVIIGNSNSGKTTLGQKLSVTLDVAFIELDALYWEPNWTPAATDIFRERVRVALEQPGWVIAGNYSQQRDVSWPKADTIVWLDLPLRTVIPRIITRSWTRWRSKEMLWGTNYENFWNHLKLWDPDTSLISFTVVNHRRRRRDFLAAMSDPRWAHATFVQLRSPGDAERWLESVATLRS